MPAHKVNLRSHLQGAAGRAVAIGCIGSHIMIGCESPGGFPLPMGDESTHQVRIWDFGTGSPLGPWITDDEGFEKAAIGEFAGRPVLACGGPDGTVRIRDARTGTLIHSLDAGGDWIQALALCEHDGRLIVVTSNGDHIVQAWDARTAKALSPRFGPSEGLTYAVTAANLRGDPVLGATDRRGTHLWNLARRAPERTFPLGDGTGYALALGRLADQPALVSINQEQRQHVYEDRWGNSTTTYSVATLRDLRKKSDSGSQILLPITRAKGVAIGELSGRPAIVSIFDEGLPRTKDNFIFVWYPRG
jgi:WD40 repeat protein